MPACWPSDRTQGIDTFAFRFSLAVGVGGAGWGGGDRFMACVYGFRVSDCGGLGGFKVKGFVGFRGLST